MFDLFDRYDELTKRSVRTFQNTNETLKTATDNVKRLENMLKEQKMMDDRLQKELNKLTMKNLTIETNLYQANAQIETMEKDIADNEKLFKVTKNELNRYESNLIF